MQTVNDIRKGFLDYFADNGHEVVASSPLVPNNDPTLMFANAGMVQFKNVFTGLEGRNYSRAVTSQKCVRAGGKHNDLENVGYTARHHTFFEMLGNFSFGDYFKEDAIELAWRLVTKEFGLVPKKLIVTVHTSDEEAASLWRKIAGLSDDKIIRIPTSDNFWAMGDTGPCGPCSEIFYDHGEHIAGGPPGSPDEDGDRFIEIWNLVFMQFEQVNKQERVSLPQPSIDTGMGLERIAAVMQGTHDNYQTDMMQVLINASAEYAGVAADGVYSVSHRVIADHLRASAFLIADGVLPCNEGRGYVLRRIMRRAMRHAHMMGCHEPLLWQLVSTLVGEMGQAFPELGRAETLINETLKLEESRFKKLLDRGINLLDEASIDLGKGAAFDGETAFKLYDTYGFPLDLTQDALRPRGITVDTDAFNRAMERQRAEARKAWTGSGDEVEDAVWFDLREELGATDFLGYKTETAQGKIVALVRDGAKVDALRAGENGFAIINQSPFYGESGGQIGDTGKISGDDLVVMVVDTQKRVSDLLVHSVIVDQGALENGKEVVLQVDQARRSLLRGNHSATHLLHEALRRQLGNHVTQKGSLVASDRLRFDISHPYSLGREELASIEAEVNARVASNTEVSTLLMDPDAAVEAGAMALFGEKYGDQVRVVTMGAENDEDRYSVELCGGTHVKRTGDIGPFKIIGESAVAAGVRRIEALTGPSCLAYFEAVENALNKAAALLKVTPEDVPARVESLIGERRNLERSLAQVRRKLVTGIGIDTTVETKEVAAFRFAPRLFDDIPSKDLKNLVDDLKNQIGSGIVAVVSHIDGKASLVVGVTDDLTDRISAVDLVRTGSEAVGGKGGGGRSGMAQAGGPNGQNGQAALDAIELMLWNA
ncbi:MAG: alanine--tRNA ligase [Rhodospirillaceae bacterium TMED8]|nr:alanine--tRNA ligase [Magnetovibrio sp.]OUT50157.1 MAG: alanine--tRNA ligase [Rhodospirillaceae bacterium TMED8]